MNQAADVAPAGTPSACYSALACSVRKPAIPPGAASALKSGAKVAGIEPAMPSRLHSALLRYAESKIWLVAFPLAALIGRVLRYLTRLILLLALTLFASGEASALTNLRVPQIDLAGQKFASGIFSETIAILCHLSASQAAETQQEKTSRGYDFASGSSLAAERIATPVQMEFAFARGASVQTRTVTKAGEVFVRVGATEASTAVRAGSYAMPEATFNTLGRSPAVLKNALDLPGSAPQYFRYIRPPAGTPIQRGIVPGGEYGGIGGYPEVIFPKGVH